MNPVPQVDVLIPVYNVANYIERCLTSVLEQKYANLRIVIVNDASPDNSMEIVQHLLSSKNIENHSVEVINRKENGGLGAVRKMGMALATGKYVLFLDSDDYWDNPFVVREWVNVAEQGTYDVVIADFCHEYMKPQYSQVVCNTPVTEGREIAYNILRGITEGYLWNKLFLRTELNKVSQMATEGIDFWEDVIVTVPFFYQVQRIGYYPKVTVHYMHYGKCQYTGTVKPSYITMQMALFEKLDAYFAEDIETDAELRLAYDQAKFRSFSILSLLPYRYYKQIRNIPYNIHPSSLPYGTIKRVKLLLYKLAQHRSTQLLGYLLVVGYNWYNRQTSSKRFR